MTDEAREWYFSRKIYIPASLSEIYDQIGGMTLYAPTFIDPSGYFPERNVDSEFYVLVEAFDLVPKKLGDERHATLVDLAGKAKALFAADPEDSNGKADDGRKLLFEIENIIQDARRRRVKGSLSDEDGEISED